MSDEAFARRFYADRSELLALGVPLESQRDDFTGEELYRLLQEAYFLPPLELNDAELAALSTAVHLLDGQFAYAEPLRLALQNLALGRPNPSYDVAPEVSVRLLGSGFTAEVAVRLQKLETAISKQRTVVFRYWAISSDEEAVRTVDPYSLYLMGGHWYVIGRDHDRDDVRTFRLDRVRGDVRFATRRERDFRVPPEFDPSAYRNRAAWQLGEVEDVATILVEPEAAWLAERTVGQFGTVEHRDDRSIIYTTPYADWRKLAQWLISQGGLAAPLSPPELVERVVTALERVASDHEGEAALARGAARAGRSRARARARRVAGHARALRRAPGDAGRRAGGLRGAQGRIHRRGRARRALQAQRRGARGSPPAAQPRQLRRRLLRRVRRARRGRPHDPRREGAVRRRVPPPGAALPARGQVAAAGARPRRPARGRGRGHRARRRAREARGRVRALRHARRAHAAADAARRGRALGALGGRAQPRGRGDPVPRATGREGPAPRRRAALPARRARRLVLRHLGSHARRRAHVPRRPHPRGQGRSARRSSAARA